MTRITGPWLTNAATQSVFAALSRDGALALLVGGCVRNALLGAPVSDIDIATDATPQTVMSLAQDAGIKAIPTGIDHGTVTLVQDGIPHEVTTFRRDVGTDGRHATVAFSTRVEEDAARRDFTMNALYARADGTVLDPLGGMGDLTARRVRFIGEAGDRIREDYLRSLRYFRFHSWYGDASAGVDADALAAISENLDGLERLSRERVGAELIKLLSAPDPAPSVAAMHATGALTRLLPGADDRAMAPLVHVEGEAGIGASGIRRLAAIAEPETAQTLRLSKVQLATLTRMREAAVGTMAPGEMGYRLGYDTALDAVLLRAALLEQPAAAGAVQEIARGAQARFPLSAKDLMPDLSGPALGAALAQLEARWIASGFTLSADALLATRS